MKGEPGNGTQGDSHARVLLCQNAGLILQGQPHIAFESIERGEREGEGLTDCKQTYK